MHGLTIREMAERLNLTTYCVKMRLRRAGIKPLSYAGITAVYPEAALETAAIARSEGRPPHKEEL
jgi:hypothetical protein